MVGPGSSGLAVWTLRRPNVQVLEASSEVGGTMRSEVVGGHILETGAQFMSSHYVVVPRLAEAMGLTSTEIAPATLIQHGGVRRFRRDRPLSQSTGGVLPWRARPRAASGARGDASARREARRARGGDCDTHRTSGALVDEGSRRQRHLRRRRRSARPAT